MALQPIHLQAHNLDALNQSLRELSLGSRAELLIDTPHWHITAWRLISRGSATPPSVMINGAEAAVLPLQSSAEHYLWAIDPYWTQPVLPEQQWLQIRGPSSTSGALLDLQASDSLSPWSLLHLLRSDIAQSTLEEMRPWLFFNGIHECNLLRQHPAVLAALNEPISTRKLAWFHTALRQQRPDLQAAFPEDDAQGLLHWLIHHGAAEHKLEPVNPEGLMIPPRRSPTPWQERTFGVNLFGYAQDVLGIGEDLRTVHSALSHAGIPVQVVPISRETSSTELRQLARDHPDQLAPHAFNLVCLTAEEHARVLLELGEAVFEDRFCIGYWPWELSRWPQAWQPLLVMVDEVWASSRHTHAALEAAIGQRSSPSLQHIPLPVERLEPLSTAERLQWRSHFELPAATPLVICSFDGRSSYARKNPWAAINVFQQAVATSTPARLVIKTLHAGVAKHHWQELQARVEADPRLHLIDTELPRDQLLGLYGCCDVLLSLHRAEGYGRVLAEALMLGLDVIATHYSGNTDFCIGPLAHPVSHTRKPVLQQEYPHGEGQHWAEPNQDEAAALLNTVLKQRMADSESRRVHCTAYQQLFNPKAIGLRYARRLQQIWAAR